MAEAVSADHVVLGEVTVDHTAVLFLLGLLDLQEYLSTVSEDIVDLRKCSSVNWNLSGATIEPSFVEVHVLSILLKRVIRILVLILRSIPRVRHIRMLIVGDIRHDLGILLKALLGVLLLHAFADVHQELPILVDLFLVVIGSLGDNFLVVHGVLPDRLPVLVSFLADELARTL